MAASVRTIDVAKALIQIADPYDALADCGFR
jgi:hypothetical protein